MRRTQWFMSFTGPPPDLIQDEDGVVWIQPLGGVTQFGGHYENLEDVLAESYDSAGASREYPSRRRGTTGRGPYTGGSWRPSRDAPNYNFNREPHPRVTGEPFFIVHDYNFYEQPFFQGRDDGIRDPREWDA